MRPLLRESSIHREMYGTKQTKVAKVAKRRVYRNLTYTTRSWNNMLLDEGNEMIDACTSRPRFQIYLERTYVTGETKTIKMCPPLPTVSADGSVQFHNGVTMIKDPNKRYFFSLAGDVLLNDEDETCDVHSDCAEGLFCNDDGRNDNRCVTLPEGHCLLERGNKDCFMLDDPLRTKCHVTENPIGGECGCDNDPSNNPCLDDTHTCDFPCELPDAIPSCESPESRNSDCVDFTGIGTSECPPGGDSSPSCTRPPTNSPTR